MKKYKISTIMLKLIILSNLSYADNNLSDKESIKEEPIMLLPQSEQVKSSSEAKPITVEDVSRRLKQIEQENIKEEIELAKFEKKVRAYQKKLESLDY
ncbi:MAG: hypothetical protein DSZ07_02240 [Sulfurovum sp.]|nr:MAG: hypothetical protein DSZ07_02240 [Sulfurovum sp.]